MAVDLMGPLPTGECILVVVGHKTIFYEVVVIYSMTAEREREREKERERERDGCSVTYFLQIWLSVYSHV